MVDALDSLKLAGLGISALENNFGRLKHPYKLNFAITNRCQSRCQACSIWRQKPGNELTLEEITEFARKNNYFKWVGLTGGEPFLRDDLVEIVEAFRSNSKGLYLVAMPTNSLSDAEMIAGKIIKILESGVPRVVITLSLDGYRELHDKLRGVPGNFDKVMNLAKRLKEMHKKYKGLDFLFGYTMSKFNQGALEQTYAAVRSELNWASYNDFHINIGQVSDIYYDNTATDMRADNVAMVEELGNFIKKRDAAIGPMQRIESVYLRKLVEYVKTGRSPMRSRSLDASLFLSSEGEVYPSIMWGRKLGNIRDTGYDLAQIWGSKEAEEVRQLIAEGKEPSSWTACEAYQSIVGNALSLL
jgi:MoaA/NifB/PqqE/SkfB family radical SAM enzyme